MYCRAFSEKREGNASVHLHMLYVYGYLEFHTIVDLIRYAELLSFTDKSRFIPVLPIIRTKKKFGFLISKLNVLFLYAVKNTLHVSDL